MADLNDPVDPATAKDPAGEAATAENATDANPTEPAAQSEVPEAKPAEPEAKPAEPEAEAADKPQAEAKPAEPEAEKPDKQEAKPAEPESATPEAKPDGDAAPAAEAEASGTPAAAAETKAADTESAEEAKPVELTKTDESKATETKATEIKAVAPEPESGTVLPDSIVSGAATTAVIEDSEAHAEDDDADAAPQAAPKPRKPLPRPRPLVAALSVLLVVLLVAGGILFYNDHRIRSEAADRTAALDVARQVATSLTTITPDNAAGQIDALTKQSTGPFKEQIGGYSAMFQAVLKQGNVASRGTITAAGIEKMEPEAASAIVAVSALITSGQVPQGQPRTYRLLVSLQRNGDQWLASNVDFVQ